MSSERDAMSARVYWIVAVAAVAWMVALYALTAVYNIKAGGS